MSDEVRAFAIKCTKYSDTLFVLQAMKFQWQIKMWSSTGY